MRDSVMPTDLSAQRSWEAQFDALANGNQQSDHAWQKAYYRNIVGAKLTALTATFRQTEAHLPEGLFKQVALAYIEAAVENTANLNLYGQGFVDCLNQFVGQHELSTDIVLLAEYEQAIQHTTFIPRYELDFALLSDEARLASGGLCIVLNPSLQILDHTVNIQDVDGNSKLTVNPTPTAVWFDLDMVKVCQLSAVDFRCLQATQHESALDSLVEQHNEYANWLAYAMMQKWIVGISESQLNHDV